MYVNEMPYRATMVRRAVALLKAGRMVTVRYGRAVLAALDDGDDVGVDADDLRTCCGSIGERGRTRKLVYVA